MRATGHPHTHNGERERERENFLGAPLSMPKWVPDEGDGWILIVYTGGKAIYLRDELPVQGDPTLRLSEYEGLPIQTDEELEVPGRFTQGRCEDCGLEKVVYRDSSLCPSCHMFRGATP